MAKIKKTEKVKRIMAILDDLYRDPPIPLAHKDAFTLLIAVLLSAQCTDERVNKTTPALFALADQAKAMAKQKVEAVHAIIRSCGLAPAKAKHIVALSKQLCELHGGEVPSSFAELEALPGIGHKSASVVMSHIFGVPAMPVDTHIHRLMRRWGISDGSKVEKTEADIKRYFPQDAWNRLHLQFIFFGRAHCPARGHDFNLCPICNWASSQKVRQQETRS